MSAATGHLLELLPEYAAGMLSEELAAELEAHLLRCGSCAAELHALEEAFDALPLGLPTVAPPPELRARILRSVVEKTQGRFEAFVGRVAALLDVATDKARAMLGRIDPGGRAPGWVDGPAGTRLLHLEVGPRVAHANCGLIRMRAGSHFPHHRHLGTEHVLILQGGLVDSSGRTMGPGDESVSPAESGHAFAALADVDLVYLVVLEVGFELAGERPDL